MATTNLIPVHTGKDGSIIKTLRRVIGYVDESCRNRTVILVTHDKAECDMMKCTKIYEL